MGYDSKGILAFNLKYEDVISFISLVKFIIKCKYHRNCSQLRPVRLAVAVTEVSHNLCFSLCFYHTLFQVLHCTMGTTVLGNHNTFLGVGVRVRVKLKG